MQVKLYCIKVIYTSTQNKKTEEVRQEEYQKSSKQSAEETLLQQN